MAPQVSDKKKKELVDYLCTFTSEHIFTQKEFEKSCPVKVPTQQMKEMLDGVMCEYPLLLDVAKCGALNVYYMYPSETRRRVIAQGLALEERSERTTRDIAEMKRRLSVEQAMRKEYRGKKEALVLHSTLQKQHATLTKKLRALQADDTNWSGERIAQEKVRLSALSASLETLTDDIEALVSYLCNKFLIEQNVLRQELEIPSEWKEM